MPLDHQLVRRVGRDARIFLCSENLPQRSHRYLYLVIRRLPRRELLELQAWPDQGAHDRVTLVLRAPHDELKRQPCHEWDHDDAGEKHLYPPVNPEQREDQDAQNQHVQDKARTATDMARVKLASILRDELFVSLVNLYSLVLCPVVRKKAFDVLTNRSDQEQVSHKDQYPQESLYEIEENRVLHAAAAENPNALCTQDGCSKEQQKRQYESEEYGNRYLLFREIFLFAQSYIGREGQRLHT